MYLDKTIIQKDTYTPVFIAAPFTISKAWKQPIYPLTDEWIKKTWHIHTVKVSVARSRDSAQPHRPQPSRLLCLRSSLSKDTGVGKPCPSPGGLSDPGTEPGSPALQADSLLSESPGKSSGILLSHKKNEIMPLCSNMDRL